MSKRFLERELVKNALSFVPDIVQRPASVGCEANTEGETHPLNEPGVFVPREPSSSWRNG